MSQSLPGFVSLIKETWSLFTSKIKPIFFLNLAFILFYILLIVASLLLGSLSISFELISMIFSGQLTDSDIIAKLIGVLPQIIAFISFFVISASLLGLYYTTTFVYLINGKEQKLGKLLSFGRSKIIPVFILGLVVFLLSLGSFWLLVIPSLIISYLLTYSFYEVILNNRSLAESLTRSIAIVWQNFWGILGRLLLLGIITTIISTLLSGGQNEDRSFLSLIFDIVAGWFTSIYGYLIYKHASKLTPNTAKPNLLWVIVPSIIGLVLMIIGLVLFVRLGATSGAFQDYWQSIS